MDPLGYFRLCSFDLRLELVTHLHLVLHEVVEPVPDGLEILNGDLARASSISLTVLMGLKLAESSMRFKCGKPKARSIHERSTIRKTNYPEAAALAARIKACTLSKSFLPGDASTPLETSTPYG